MSDEHARARRSARSLRLTLIAVLTTALLAVGPAAWAYWSASQTLPTVTLNAGRLDAPAPRCLSVPRVGGTAPLARISWDPVPAAASYTLTLSANINGTNPVGNTTVTATAYDLSGNLLSGLLVLLGALLSGQPIYVFVQANHTTGWNSNLSTPVPVTLAGLGLDGGMKCYP
jgi:hypothetical protein